MIALMFTRDAAVLALMVGVLSVQEPRRPLWLPAAEHVASPAAADSGQPQLSVSRRGTLLSWIERQGQRATLKFSERTHSGWSEPRTVASGSDWFVNWADVPSVVRLDDGTVVAHWLQTERTRHLRLRRSPLVFEGRRQDLVEFFHTAHRRHAHRARLRVALPDAGCRPWPDMARRPQHEAGVVA